MNQELNNQQPVQPTPEPVPVAPVEPVQQPIQPAVEQPVYPTVENQKKKSKVPIIILILIIVAAIAGVAIFFATRDDSGSSKKKDKEESTSVNIEYYGGNGKNTKQIFFTLPSYMSEEDTIFIGIDTGSGDNKLVVDSIGSKYNEIKISEYESGRVSMHADDNYYSFDVEMESYEKKDGTDYYDNDEVVYQDGNYFVVANNIDSYTLLYRYGEDIYEWGDGNTGKWYALLVNFYDTIDDCKTKIADLKKRIDICTFSGEATSCTSNGKTIKFENYTHFKNVIINYLKDNNLYVKSYKYIDEIDDDEVTVRHTYKEKDKDTGAEKEYTNTFHIEIDSLREDEEADTFKLNGMTVRAKMSNYDTLYAYSKYKDNNELEIRVNLDYSLDETKDNQIEAIKKCFSK